MIIQPPGTYDSPAYYDNVYGHALELLARRRTKTSDGEIHLDVGCGFGRIAEKIQSDFKRLYVGVDGDQHGLSSLQRRGFEAHKVWLEGKQETLTSLNRVVGDRSVASMTFLDTLEHLVDGEAVLAAIAEFARKHGAGVVVSTPNVTHRDVGSKLVFGQWDYTDKGLLDHTHVRLFDDELFVAFLNNAGLQVVDRFDVRAQKSDQCFPPEHSALAGGTILNELLVTLSEQANEHSVTSQFVCLCAPMRESECPTFVTSRAVERPFISVVVRTQGRRPHTLVEVLTCLCGQTDTDFEILVVGHKLEGDVIKMVERIIDDAPYYIREKIRLIRVDAGGRARPLNVGFQEARGRYIAILDDDDIPMGHYVQTFRELSEKHPGRVLRTACVRQDVLNVTINGRIGLRASGPPNRVYAAEFDLFDHLIENRSPPISLAFPRGAFHNLRYRFDEELKTTEDWDYLLRVAAVCGVASSPSITGIYRWWLENESSRSVHSEDEWASDRDAIIRKQDKTFLILPKEYVRRLRNLLTAAAQNPQRASPTPSVQEPIERKPTEVDWTYLVRQSVPPELRMMLIQGVRRKIGFLKLKYYAYLPLRNRRRRYRARIRAQREILNRIR